MLEDQPDCTIVFSWYVAAELAPKLRAKRTQRQVDHAIADAKFPLKGIKACPLDSNPRRSDGSAEAALRPIRPFIQLAPCPLRKGQRQGNSVLSAMRGTLCTPWSKA
jgi:hypothetical protein